MVNFWEKWACSKGMRYDSILDLVTETCLDPENLLVMVQTWQNGDVSKQEPYNQHFEKAMSAIKARTLVLPGKTDLYFP